MQSNREDLATIYCQTWGGGEDLPCSVSRVISDKSAARHRTEHDRAYLHAIDEVGLLVQRHIAGPEAGCSHPPLAQPLQAGLAQDATPFTSRSSQPENTS